MRTGGGDQLGCLDAVHAGHADVHDDHVGAGVPGRADPPGSVAGLAGGGHGGTSSATRNSVSHARLRQFLILLCRVLAVAMLVLFLARPLAGGWLGWALSPAPDAIVILLDRSASMETKAGATTKRQQALQLLAQAASGI